MLNANLHLVKDSVTKAVNELDVSSRNAANEMKSALTQLAKEEIAGARPYTKVGKTRVYEKATPGQPPMNRTGTLRRSIHGTLTREGFATYTLVVGPSVVYGRAVELGGQYAPRSWRGTGAMQGFPYLSPAMAKMRPLMPTILRKHLGWWSV